jgi:hypothetical protein
MDDTLQCFGPDLGPSSDEDFSRVNGRKIKSVVVVYNGVVAIDVTKPKDTFAIDYFNLYGFSTRS